jgi:hypothetical protein
MTMLGLLWSAAALAAGPGEARPTKLWVYLRDKGHTSRASLTAALRISLPARLQRADEIVSDPLTGDSERDIERGHISLLQDNFWFGPVQ